MSNAEEYRRHAQECLDAARRLQNEEEQAMLLHIAQIWMDLAEKEGAQSSASEPPAAQQQQVQPKDDKKE
jgi:hypothetical protein